MGRARLRRLIWVTTCATTPALVLLAGGCADGSNPEEAAVRTVTSDAERGWWTIEAVDDLGQARGLPQEPRGESVEVVRLSSDVYFTTGSSDIDPSEAPRLRKAAEWIIANQIEVVIVGHTDDVGTASYNEQLGLDRAESIREGLVELGVPKRQLAGVDSEGETCPIESNETDAGRSANRRVEIQRLGSATTCD